MKLPQDPRLPILGGQDYDRSLYQRLYELFRTIAQCVNDGVDVATGNTEAIAEQGLDIAEFSANAQWYGKAIGEPFSLRDDIVGVAVPPTDNPNFRFIRLTASDAYNSGVLASETVSGSAPNIVATAVISLAGSPINGRTVHLENTMRTFDRAGDSGVLQGSQNLTHTHSTTGQASFAGGTTGVVWALTGGNTNLSSTNAAGGDESRPRNIGKTRYMRVK